VEGDGSVFEVDFGVGVFVGVEVEAVVPVFRDDDETAVPDRVL